MEEEEGWRCGGGETEVWRRRRDGGVEEERQRCGGGGGMEVWRRRNGGVEEEEGWRCGGGETEVWRRRDKQKHLASERVVEGTDNVVKEALHLQERGRRAL